MHKYTEKIPEYITVEGTVYSFDEIALLPLNYWGNTNKGALLHFLKAWISPSPDIILQSSGTTGAPKSIPAKKADMCESAINSCRFFSLEKGMSTLISLPMEYIAAKMMVIRAILAEMNIFIIDPIGNPFQTFNRTVDFIPLVPMQVLKTLTLSPHHSQRNCIRKCEKILIGGAAISTELENIIEKEPNNYYASYGMTETLSHVAIRPLNGEKKSNGFTPLPEYKVEQSSSGTAIVYTPWNKNPIYTNDCIELNRDRTFTISGRIDNVINSGGIKLHPEILEKKIEHLISSPFAFSSIPDPILGEALILIVQEHENLFSLRESLIPLLEKHQMPRKLFQLPIPQTSSGKIIRQQLKAFLYEKTNNREIV